MTTIMEKLGMQEGEPIEHGLISKAIENAQRRVEGHNFDIRKHILEYDDVMNQQREVIYQQRREILCEDSLKPSIMEMIRERAENIADRIAGENSLAEQWDLKLLADSVFDQFNFRLTIDESRLENLDAEQLADLIFDAAVERYEEKERQIGSDEFRRLERFVMLQCVDNLWKDHLLNMDHLKEGIGLRGYAQQNPLIAYKKEGFEMFQEMVSKIQEQTVGILARVQPVEPTEMAELRKPDDQNLVFSHGEGPARKQPVRRDESKVGRNDPCPCGSGRKYKKCCGQ